MILSSRNFDRLWYVVVALSVTGILLVSHYSFALGNFGVALLFVSLAVAGYISLCVRRQEAETSESLLIREIKEETTASESVLDDINAVSLDFGMLHASSTAPETQPLVYKVHGSFVEQATETTVIRGKAFEEAVFESLLSLQKITSSHRAEQRRNVLKEARELALKMRGTNLAVHVSPNSEIAICESSRSTNWNVVSAPEIQTTETVSASYVN